MVVTISKAFATMVTTHLSFFFQYIKLCSLYFLLSIFILAVVNDINSAKIKNLESES